MADRTCSIDGCELPAKARGWCNKHWCRWSKYGDPLGSAVKPTPEQRFWDKVDRDGPISHLGTKCWNWTRATNNQGYGQIRYHGRLVLSHRLAYAFANGMDAAGLVDHKCHNPLCVNPGHLRSVTSKQNLENKSGLATNNTSGVRGVTWNKRNNKWRAQVGHNGRNHSAGDWDTIEEAEAAVVAKRIELHTHNDLDRVA